MKWRFWLQRNRKWSEKARGFSLFFSKKTLFKIEWQNEVGIRFHDHGSYSPSAYLTLIFTVFLVLWSDSLRLVEALLSNQIIASSGRSEEKREWLLYAYLVLKYSETYKCKTFFLRSDRSLSLTCCFFKVFFLVFKFSITSNRFTNLTFF